MKCDESGTDLTFHLLWDFAILKYYEYWMLCVGMINRSLSYRRSDWLRSRSQRETCNAEMSEHTGLEQCGMESEMESNENQWTRRDWTWLNLPGMDLRVWEWIDCGTVTLPLSLSEIVTSSRKWRPLECNQNYHRLEFDRNQHHMKCDGNYCRTSGQKVFSKVWNVWTFPNFSDIKCFRLNITFEVQKCASGWSWSLIRLIDLWIAARNFRNDPHGGRTNKSPLATCPIVSCKDLPWLRA